MAVHKLNKSEWGPFCDALSKTLENAEVEIAVESLTLGAQVEADWLPLLGITYDPKDDLIEIALEGLDHMIRNPRELLADFGDSGIATLAITSDDAVTQLIRFREPLRVAAPAAG